MFIVAVTDSPIGKVSFNSSVCKIRALFQCDFVSVSPGIAHWNNHVSSLCWKKVWTLPQKFLFVNKVKEVSFKMIDRGYPVRSFFFSFLSTSKMILTWDVPSMTLILKLLHLFWRCIHTHKLWQDICRFVLNNITCNFWTFTGKCNIWFCQIYYTWERIFSYQSHNNLCKVLDS